MNCYHIKKEKKKKNIKAGYDFYINKEAKKMLEIENLNREDRI